ncbi:MAG: hypothetical protein ACLUOB_10680 [Subdoligranulum sp.]
MIPEVGKGLYHAYPVKNIVPDAKQRYENIAAAFAGIKQFRAIPHNSRLTAQAPLRRLRHGICVAKMLDNVGLRYPHRASGAKALALCDRRPCFGSLFPPLAALTFAASSIICAFGLASAAPRSPYRHLELCGIALENRIPTIPNVAGHLCGALFTTRAQQ